MHKRKNFTFSLLLLFFLFAYSSSAQIIEGSDFICLNGSTELTANDSMALSYNWSTGEMTQSISVDVPGWYYLDMEAADGTMLMDSIFLTLSALPDNSITLLGSQNICLGSSTLINAQPNLNYQWSSGEDQQSISPSSGGNYFCILTDPYSGCQSISDTITIGVYEFLGISVEPEGVYCVGDTVTLTAPEADMYIWSTGESTQTITTTGSGSYNVVVDNGDCTTDLSQNVIFNASPNVNLGFDQEFCESVFFSLCGPLGMQSYLWCDGSTSQCIDGFVENQTYCLTVTSYSGCEATDSITFSITDPIVPEISVIGGTENACAGDTLILQSSLAVQSWNTGDFTQSIEVTSSGDYWLLATDMNGCPTDTGFIDVTFHDLPEAVIVSNEDLTQCPADDFSLILSTDTYDSYLWSVFAVTQDITVNDVGEYYVIVSDEFGCSDTSDIVTVGFYDVPVIGAISGSDNPSINSTEEYVLTNFDNASYHWTVIGGEILGDSTGNSILIQWFDY